MSAFINFHLGLAPVEPVIEGPFGAVTGYVAGVMSLRLSTANGSLSILGSNDQLADIAKAILAHLEKQEAGDFEKEVA